MPSIESPAERIEKRRDYRGPVFLKQGFRPFFLGAGMWSAIAMALWLLSLVGGAVSPRFDLTSMLDWHMHEMLFGFVAAAIAGFLLTAVPNWTGRLPVRGWPLAALALLWLAGRLALLPFFPREGIASVISAGIDALFLPALAVMIGREIVIGRNWRNLPVLGILAALALANILFHLAAQGLLPALASNSVAFAALMLAVLLIALIGGRIVPSFTRNWLVQQGATQLPAPFDRVDQAGAALVAISALLLVVLPDAPATGILALAAGVAHAFRLSRWQGQATLKEPLVAILHVGYGWVAIGFLLAGLAILTSHVPPIAAIHAFAAGAVGTMVLAVMTRATRGHTGAPLSADRGTVAVYALVTLAALVRVAGAILDFGAAGYLVSGLAWIAAFALFALLYLPLFMADAGKLPR